MTFASLAIRMFLPQVSRPVLPSVALTIAAYRSVKAAPAAEVN